MPRAVLEADVGTVLKVMEAQGTKVALVVELLITHGATIRADLGDPHQHQFDPTLLG